MTSEKYVKNKYPQYFAPEMKFFMNRNWFNNCNESVEEINKNLSEDFYKLRKIGENESYICELIRDDNCEDFIALVNRKNITLKSRIELSFCETNSFLIKKQNESNKSENYRTTLIEYAAFFGSIQIIRYLKMAGVEIEPKCRAHPLHRGLSRRASEKILQRMPLGIN